MPRSQSGFCIIDALDKFFNFAHRRTSETQATLEKTTTDKINRLRLFSDEDQSNTITRIRSYAFSGRRHSTQPSPIETTSTQEPIYMEMRPYIEINPKISPKREFTFSSTQLSETQSTVVITTQDETNRLRLLSDEDISNTTIRTRSYAFSGRRNSRQLPPSPLLLETTSKQYKKCSTTLQDDSDYVDMDSPSVVAEIAAITKETFLSTNAHSGQQQDKKCSTTLQDDSDYVDMDSPSVVAEIAAITKETFISTNAHSGQQQDQKCSTTLQDDSDYVDMDSLSVVAEIAAITKETFISTNTHSSQQQDEKCSTTLQDDSDYVDMDSPSVVAEIASITKEAITSKNANFAQKKDIKPIWKYPLQQSLSQLPSPYLERNKNNESYKDYESHIKQSTNRFNSTLRLAITTEQDVPLNAQQPKTSEQSPNDTDEYNDIVRATAERYVTYTGSRRKYCLINDVQQSLTISKKNFSIKNTPKKIGPLLAKPLPKKQFVTQRPPPLPLKGPVTSLYNSSK